MANWLVPAIISVLVSTLVLTVVYAYLHLQFRQSYLLIWTMAWVAYAARFIFELVYEISGEPIPLLLASQVAVLVSGLLLLWGTYRFLGRAMPWVWSLATSLGIAWLIACGLIHTSFLVLTAPNYTLLGVEFVWCGWVMLKAESLNHNSRLVLGWAFVIWGLHKFDYPFLREVSWYAPAGFLFAAALELLIAFGFFLVYFQRVFQERRQVEERFKNFFKYSPAGMAMVDRDLRFVAVNDALTHIDGLGAEDVGSHATAMARDLLSGPVAQVFATRKAVTNFETGLQASGQPDETLLFQASFFPLWENGIEPASVGMVLVDHTARKRIENSLQQRVAELEAVSRISTILRSEGKLSDLLPTIVKEILNVMRAQSGAIMLYNTDTSQFDLAEVQGWANGISEDLVRSRQSFFEAIMKREPPFVVAELAGNDEIPPDLRAAFPPGQGGAALPIRGIHDPVGLLFIFSQAPFQISPVEMRMLCTLVEMVGSAVYQARLRERTDRNLQRLAALHEIDSIITSSLDLKLTLEVLLGHAIKQMQVDAAEIYRFNPLSQRLDYEAGRGFRAYRGDQRALRPGQGLAGAALVERRMVEMRSDRTLSAERGWEAAYRTEDFQVGWALPLLSKGQVTGVLVALSREMMYIDPDALEFFGTLANQAALAIEDIGLVEKLRRSNLEMAQTYMATIRGLARVVELRKQEPERHTEKLADQTLRLAAALDVPQKDWLSIQHGVFLHDVGLMWVPDAILLKEGPLTDEEWQVVHRHPQFVYDLFSPITSLLPALDIPYCHHERWDGSGYPRGLKNEQIPLAARIFAVVEAWDSLQVKRPFRAAMPADQALAEIQALSGTAFDPQVVAAFNRLPKDSS